MPYSLKRVTLPKITRNKDESLAVISFYDPVDLRDKIWTFTEDTGFVEHFDLAPEVCSDCKNYDASDPFFSHPSTFHSLRCSSSIKQILRII